jgi:hypothetical protein
VAQLDYLATHTSLSPIWRGFSPAFVNYKKGNLDSQPQEILQVACKWSVVLSWFSASSTTKTGRHDIAEILLKVALNTIKSINQNQ